LHGLWQQKITRIFLRHVRYRNHRFIKDLPVKPVFFPDRAALVLSIFATAQSGQLLSPEWPVNFQNSRSNPLCLNT